MSLQQIYRVTCDNCGASVIINSGDSLEVARMVEKRNWIFQRVDFYGNEVQFCNSACQELFWQKMDVMPEGTQEYRK